MILECRRMNENSAALFVFVESGWLVNQNS